jgi:glycosyltransferase involved in cell wall biosynthesis
VSEQETNTDRSLLILCQLFYPELVSTGQTMTEFAEQLAALGVEVEVLCGPPTILGRRQRVPKHLLHRGIRVRRVWGTRFPKLSLVGRILNQLTFACAAFLHLLLSRPKKPILVLTNPPFLAMGCALLRRLKLGPPYLYLVFDVYPDTAVRLGLLRKGGWIARLWDRLNRFAYRHAAAIVVIGRCMKDVVEPKLQATGLDASDKLHHLPVWCDDLAIRATASPRAGLAEECQVANKFVVGYFGNMGRFHDLETIMEAAELLKDQADIAFLFVGEGHKKQWAIHRARERGLDNCRFHPYVPREDLGHLLALADLGLVSLLEGQEGLSVPAKTYGLMAAGVPVLAIVPATSEIARMVEETACGARIPPGDHHALAQRILELKHDPAQARAMGIRGTRAIEQRYNLKNICHRYMDLIADIGLWPNRPAAQSSPPHAATAQRETVDDAIPVREHRASTQGTSRKSKTSGCR